MTELSRELDGLLKGHNSKSVLLCELLLRETQHSFIEKLIFKGNVFSDALHQSFRGWAVGCVTFKTTAPSL